MAEDDAGLGAALDTMPGNRAGRASALTTLTPLPRRWTWFVRLVLAAKSLAGPDRTLRRLSFIHSAAWVVVRRFPGEPRRQRYSYLLFASNFNGSWFDYIDAFSRLVPMKMALLWGSSYGFPGAMPPRAYTDYIRFNDQPLAHYFSAYPSATTTEIASATRVESAFVETMAPALRGGDDARVAAAWRELVTRVQRDL